MSQSKGNKERKNKVKILVVEDNTDILKILKKGLQEHKYEVVEASEGYEGLYKYLRYRPALIILDVMMPGLDGFEVCREIRREIKDERTPIIMLTAKGEDYDRIKGKVIGATKYKMKPFEWDDLLGTIRECLG